MTDRAAVAERLAELEALIADAERLGDPAARERTRAIVAAVLDLHRGALARALEIVAAAGAAGDVVDALAQDEQVAPVLLLHGLHPVPLETRVRGAVDRLRAGGVDVEVVDVTDREVRLRLGGAVSAGGNRSQRAHAVVEAAVVAAAPDAETIEIDDGGVPARDGFVLVDWVGRARGAASSAGGA